MTNEMIILNARVKLMNEGVINLTDQIVTVENDKGEKVQMPMPEEIHTYAKWKALGFQVRKGEKAIAQIPVWKPAKGKKKTEEADDEKVKVEKKPYMFLKTASFFSSTQVEPICENPFPEGVDKDTRGCR